LIGRPVVGPNALRLVEWLTATLTTTGLPAQKVSAAVWAVHSHVAGAAAAEAMFPTERRKPRDEVAFVTARSDLYPVLASNPHVFHDGVWTPTFLDGLDFLLAGIAAAPSASSRQSAS
jgi:hypothetical protein